MAFIVSLGYLWFCPHLQTLLSVYPLKVRFKLFFLTAVNNYCKEGKIKLLINVYI